MQATHLTALGEPAEQIVEVAHSQVCDLVAMSTHGRTALGRGLLGSVTDSVILSSHVPTLAITSEAANRYGSEATISGIMAPLDGTPFAERALPYVEYLARELSLEVTLARSADMTGAYSGFALVDITEEIAKAAGDYLEEVASDLRARGCELTAGSYAVGPAGRWPTWARSYPTTWSC